MFNSGAFNSRPFNGSSDETPKVKGEFSSATITESDFDNILITLTNGSFKSITESYSSIDGLIRDGVFISSTISESNYDSILLKMSIFESMEESYSTMESIISIPSKPIEFTEISKSNFIGSKVINGSFKSVSNSRSHYSSIYRTYMERPTIHDGSESIFIYDRDERLRLILSDNTVPHFDSWIKEQLNGEVSIEFSVLSNHPEVHKITNDGRVVTRDQDGNFMEFIIRNIEDVDGAEGPFKRVYAEGGEYELLDEFVHSYINVSTDIGTALRAILEGTRWEVGQISDKEDYRSVEIKNKSTKYAVHYLLDLFKLEVRYRVEFRGNRIRRRFIDVLDRRGDSKYKKRFEDGKDIISVSRVLNSEGIKTALYGYGASSEGGTRTDFTTVEWSVANGDPIDKPLHQAWVGDPRALEQWGYQGGRKHKFGFYDGQEEDPATLLLNTWEELQNLTKLRETYNIEVVQLSEIYDVGHEKVRLGDVVYSIDRRINPPLEIENSIIEYRHNLNDRRLSEVTLGMFRSEFDLSERMYNMEQDWNDSRGELEDKPGRSEVENEIKDKVDNAIEEADRLIDEAKKQIEQAMGELDQAVIDLENSMIDLDDAMVVADSIFTDRINNRNNYKGYFEGDVGITGELHVAGTIVGGSGATIRGSLNANNLNLYSANILNANIQNANITGSLNSVGGTFTGKLVAANGTFTGTLTSVDGTFVGDLIGARIYSQSTVFVGSELMVTDGINLGSTSDYASTKYINFNGSVFLTNDWGWSRRGLKIEAPDAVFINSKVIQFGWNPSYPHELLQEGRRIELNAIGGTNENAMLWINSSSPGAWYLRSNGVNRHTFYGNGTKDGGSIEIDDNIYGMSPIDSPQTLLFDLISNVEINGQTTIYLDELFSKTLSDYSVFSCNPDVRLLSKTKTHFVVEGNGLTDFQIIGTRVGFEGTYFTDMSKQSEDTEKGEDDVYEEQSSGL